ncbi:MAG: Cys-tRNA(Pro) deacylase [Johnsonella sp.]|nr:Cys-tRNA(Pro) deacylase [Johnsonella sp.]
MTKQKESKTNAMRLLDAAGISYSCLSYEADEFEDGIHTADALGLDHEKVFKTLVTLGASRNYYVFVLPLTAKLDLKKAAKSVKEKSLEMIAVKDIKNITGYVRGGCTAIGMKKRYTTRIDLSAKPWEDIYISAGKIGYQLNIRTEDFLRISGAEYADLSDLNVK